MRTLRTIRQINQLRQDQTQTHTGPLKRHKHSPDRKLFETRFVETKTKNVQNMQIKSHRVCCLEVCICIFIALPTHFESSNQNQKNKNPIVFIV